MQRARLQGGDKQLWAPGIMIRPKSLYLEIMRNKVEKVWSVWSIPNYSTSSVMASVLMNVAELGHEMNQSHVMRLTWLPGTGLMEKVGTWGKGSTHGGHCNV